MKRGILPPFSILILLHKGHVLFAFFIIQAAKDRILDRFIGGFCEHMFAMRTGEETFAMDSELCMRCEERTFRVSVVELAFDGHEITSFLLEGGGPFWKMQGRARDVDRGQAISGFAGCARETSGQAREDQPEGGREPGKETAFTAGSPKQGRGRETEERKGETARARAPAAAKQTDTFFPPRGPGTFARCPRAGR